MRRRIKGKKPKRVKNIYKKKIRFSVITFLILILLLLFYIRINSKIMPTVMTIAHIKANSIATEAISKAVNDAFRKKNITAQDLVVYDYNDEGEIVSWSINTPVINELCADIVVGITKELENSPKTTIKVPLGNITEGKIFANIGPKISIQVLPTGSAVINYDKEFRSTGINQINHTVWLNVDTVVKVVIPMSSEEIRVSRKVILVDKVLSGKVPPSYVDTTQDSILDAELEDPFEPPKAFEYPSVN
ncbi:MAG TPA: sporulation protein YunB [Defluviitaleaceae bacterium]|nr:sporulation protein YunB [Candidatus Epulonipiscium sp.]HOQ17307.1 sporulation protein YunB [Defluviitaleaceae bacterium]HPT76348.1 sporulation protein YunB [Defluviitaleaceae bacterium]HQD50615.1 sporulation protein YunB [Defluviitaleaceae bacterium]